VARVRRSHGGSHHRRFGAYVPSTGSDATGAWIQLPGMEDLDDSDIFWSLSQPFLASRRVVLSFDVLSDVRERMQRMGIDASSTSIPLLPCLRSDCRT